jgi:hypothetical protein
MFCIHVSFFRASINLTTGMLAVLFRICIVLLNLPCFFYSPHPFRVPCKKTSPFALYTSS